MSDTGIDITTETGISVEARPPTAVRADQFTLPSTYQFAPRQVVPSTQALVGTGPGYEQDFFKPTVGPTPVGQDKFLLYTGPRLVNERGVVTRGQYDPDEAYGLLASLPKAERMALQSELYARGLYDNSRPSLSGFDSQDIEAMKKYLLVVANRNGVTADNLRSPALAYLRAEFPTVEKSGGARVRVSSKEDISEVLRGESLRLLGRAMTPAEVRQAVSYVQQTQTQRQVTGQDVPALSTLGEMAVGQGREQEMQVQGAARAAAVLERLLGR